MKVDHDFNKNTPMRRFFLNFKTFNGLCLPYFMARWCESKIIMSNQKHDKSMTFVFFDIIKLTYSYIEKSKQTSQTAYFGDNSLRKSII